MRLTKVILLCCSLLMASARIPATAAPFSIIADSTVRPAHTHRLNEQAFLERYGTDDTSHALITYYFAKRDVNKGLLIGFGIPAVIAAGAAGSVFLSASTLTLVHFFLIVSLLAIAYVTTLGLVIAGTFFILNNRRRLHRWVRNYHNGNGLPGKVRRKKSFLRLLK